MASFWIGFISGIWLIVSPWILDFNGISLAKWGAVLVGLILAITFAWELFGEKEQKNNTKEQ